MSVKKIEMRVAATFALVFAASLNLAFSQSSVTINTKLDSRGIGDKNALSHLIDIGLRNGVSLGIVIEGDSLCISRLTEGGEETTVGSLLIEIERQVPGYMGEVWNGHVFVHPKMMEPQTKAILNLVVPEFSTQKGDPQQVGISLWMYIRAVLVPKEGSGFVGGSSNRDKAIDPFEISNATVESILDLILAKEKGGGVWVMHQAPPDWLLKPKSVPYGIFEYSVDQQLLSSLTCKIPN